MLPDLKKGKNIMDKFLDFIFIIGILIFYFLFFVVFVIAEIISYIITIITETFKYILFKEDDFEDE